MPQRNKSYCSGRGLNTHTWNHCTWKGLIVRAMGIPREKRGMAYNIQPLETRRGGISKDDVEAGEHPKGGKSRSRDGEDGPERQVFRRMKQLSWGWEQ